MLRLTYICGFRITFRLLKSSVDGSSHLKFKNFML
jgi:hypothetical protein